MLSTDARLALARSYFPDMCLADTVPIRPAPVPRKRTKFGHGHGHVSSVVRPSSGGRPSSGAQPESLEAMIQGAVAAAGGPWDETLLAETATFALGEDWPLVHLRRSTFATALQGVEAIVPWPIPVHGGANRAHPGEARPHVLPLAALARRLLGVASPFGPVLRLVLAPPYSLTLRLDTDRLVLEEREGSQDARSERAGRVLRAMLGLDVPLHADTSPHLGRECVARVFRLFSRRPMDHQRLLALHPGLATPDGEFNRVVCRHPDHPDTPLCVYALQLNLLGPLRLEHMPVVMRKLLPMVLQAERPLARGPPAQRGGGLAASKGGPTRAKKRPREDESSPTDPS